MHSQKANRMSLPERKHLPHLPPPWVADDSCFFITINAQPKRVNQLVIPARAGRILQSVAFYHGEGMWWSHLFLLMPDHLHALLSVAPDRTLTHTIRAWKSWQAKTCGIKWQTGFFEHRIRSNQSFEEKAAYIRQNPVRAGLVSRAEDWPFVWSAVSY